MRARWLNWFVISTLCLGILTAASGPALGGGTRSTRPAHERPYAWVVRVYFADVAERDRLAVELGAEEASTRGGYLTVVADRALLDEIIARGLRYTIDQPATARLNDPATFYGGYKTVEEMQGFLDAKVAAHPTLAQKIDIGDSWCKTHAPCVLTNPALQWNGYDLWVLRVTNQSITGTKPVFWFDAGIHSREIATPEVAMRFIDWLLEGYETDADARWLVDYHEIYVMPMFNPDGHHMVEYGGDSPIYQRKNADYDDGCTIWGDAGSQLGTDLNRNFPFLWDCCGGSSSFECDQTYHGPSAGSEEETQAVVNRLRSLIPDQRGELITDTAPLTTTGVYQNMHSYAELNLFPWGQPNSDPAGNHADLNNIGQHISAPDAGPPGNGYWSCRGPECLYGTDGDSIDWAYGELGIPAYTTELSGGSGGFMPPYEEVDSFLWPGNRGMLIYLAKIARTPYLLARGPDANLTATGPITVPQGMVTRLSATINYAWTGNTYAQNVAAAEYYLDTPPWAGGTPLALAPVDGAFDEPTEAVEAFVDTSALALGRHIIFVRGRGVNDYGGFQSWGPASAVFVWVSGGAARVYAPLQFLNP